MTDKLLVPIGAGGNEGLATAIKQTRQATEDLTATNKLSATEIASYERQQVGAYKYESNATVFYDIKPNQSIYYNPKVLEYMKAQKQKDPTLEFAYLSAIYEGTAFVTTLTKVDTKGKLTWAAAFESDNGYLRQSTSAVVNDGSILYQLQDVSPELIGAPAAAGTVEGKMKALTDEQLKTLRTEVAPEFRSAF
jgi:hypothetical protein